MSWLSYKITAESGTTFTHPSKLENLREAQAEWEQEFNQKAASIALDDDDPELDFSDLFEVIPQVEYHVSALIEDRAWYEDFLAEAQNMNEETEA
ncbi:hypothetical protein NDI37_26815 [Funiculus sociatus GB2-A5]|uniref:Uncharacterized protein n=1 Tax=Funiculus sociatus GB2-A5 TaxID=2933946 RepID=A0ABV0JX63_9CYAN|nr:MULTISPECIES: hypothetical protein [unclassified Trichocoleus]MBD1907884.1 hypothetical protein [Trichocoleus sp. FACHB-832]MBD2064193.1 hypothetical protein [Trichocoleus sp. FACHB-6]